MIFLILWMCTDATRTNCYIEKAKAMPETMTFAEQKVECDRRMSATDWMLAKHRFMSCEEGTYED